MNRNTGFPSYPNNMASSSSSPPFRESANSSDQNSTRRYLPTQHHSSRTASYEGYSSNMASQTSSDTQGFRSSSTVINPHDYASPIPRRRAAPLSASVHLPLSVPDFETSHYDYNFASISGSRFDHYEEETNATPQSTTGTSEETKMSRDAKRENERRAQKKMSDAGKTIVAWVKENEPDVGKVGIADAIAIELQRDRRLSQEVSNLLAELRSLQAKNNHLQMTNDHLLKMLWDHATATQDAALQNKLQHFVSKQHGD
ncbi:hypothetical protein SISSUDRAFT_1119447 [Sistotremastrum suecicum HHB10207 ss-3]|uniref:Uncharacterized protein n=1 Tax=Sistotremastrum suecicum HHB10207 ss-3 TaxID=1314776 RepID=A0A166DNI2_9AGAM|nr:hypothetical protein SISSUDRAFT_1119447 [Sistotremastrum suecicum HHB10207 ss-3]